MSLLISIDGKHKYVKLKKKYLLLIIDTILYWKETENMIF